MEQELPHPFTRTKSSLVQITQRVVPETEFSMPSPCLALQQLVAMSHMLPFPKEKVLQVTLKSNCVCCKSVLQSGSLKRLH
jgi:hypothetical protein